MLQAVMSAAPVIKETLQNFKAVTDYMKSSKKKEKRAAPAPATRVPRNKGAERRLAAPVSMGVSSNSLVRTQTVSTTANACVVRGQTFLGTLGTGAGVGTSVPVCIFFASSNPITFADRMRVQASIYDKFVFRRCRLKYQPSCTTATAGTIAITIDRDYADAPQLTNWAQTLSYESYATGNVWCEHSCDIGRDTHERRAYFTNFMGSQDLHESEQFKFYVYTIGVDPNVTLGNLFLEYELELISPVYAPTEIANNLDNLGVMTVEGVGGTDAALKQSGASAVNFTMPSLPTVDKVGVVYEVIYQQQATPTNITIGNGGMNWVPGQTSVQLFMRVVNDTSVNVFTDLGAALSGSSIAALWTTASGAAGNLVFPTTAKYTYRVLNGFNASN